MLLGIKTELTVAFENYTAGYGPAIENHTPGTAFKYVFPIDDSGFVFYQTNNAVLGDLPDDDLRELIIKCYLQTQVILNSHRLNNDMLEALERYYSMLTAGHSNQLPILIAEKEEALNAYGNVFVFNYRNAAALINDTLPRIEKAVRAIDAELSGA